MKHAAVISLCIISFFISTDIYTPSMPEIARDFHETSDEVQRTMSYFLLGAVLSTLLSGLFADRLGKKKFFMLGMVLAGSASVLTIFCTSLEWLIFGRFLQGLGGAVATVVGYAVIQELYTQDKVVKIYGLFGILFAGVPAIAPLFGGIISTHFGWHMIFIIIMVLFGLSFIGIWLGLPASLNKRSRHSGFEILKSYKLILSSWNFLALILPFSLYYSVEWFYLTFLPFYLQDTLNLSAEFYGIVIGILLVGFAAGSYIASKLITSIGVHKTILTGLYLGLMAALMLWVTFFIVPKSVIAICASLFIFLFGSGILYPSMAGSSLNVFRELKTQASSVRGLMSISFAYLGSFSAEWANESSLIGLAFYVLICGALAFGIYQMKTK